MKIREGEKIPIGYGYAWQNWESLTHEVYLVPFNIILRKLRDLWFKLMKREVFERDMKPFRVGVKWSEDKKELNIERVEKIVKKEGFDNGWDFAFEAIRQRHIPDKEYYKWAKKTLKEKYNIEI